MMEAIVLAGGFGTRLRQAVPELPKPMAPILGRPFLAILLSSFARKGFRRVVLSVGFMADKIEQYFGQDYAGMSLVYAIEDKPLGTGGAVRLAMESCLEDHVFIFNGDTYLDLEVEAVERHWLQHRSPLIVGRTVPDTARYGRLLAERGRIIGFTEKGLTGEGLINAGCYVLNKGQLNEFALYEPFSLETDYLAKVLQCQRFDLFITEGHFIDIGVPEDYLKAQTELAGL
ncbi:MAG: nucleotidyltransferase family protein [Gammaproteobacteria bacterium]